MTARMWNSAKQLTLNCEGGFQCDPADDGNWTGGRVGKGKLVGTSHGISAAAYPNEDIVNMTQERAEYLYKRDYWDKCKCDYLPDCLSVAVFDFAINSGTDRAIKYLQKAITGITVDGIIGNQTIGAANRVPIRKVLKQYMDDRTDFIYRWAQNPKNKKFEQGIIKRIEKVRKFCEELI